MSTNTMRVVLMLWLICDPFLKHCLNEMRRMCPINKNEFVKKATTSVILISGTISHHHSARETVVCLKDSVTLRLQHKQHPIHFDL